MCELAGFTVQPGEVLAQLKYVYGTCGQAHVCMYVYRELLLLRAIYFSLLLCMCHGLFICSHCPVCGNQTARHVIHFIIGY